MISKLREAREAAGYSIEYVAGKLNIRKQYLLALEEGNYEIMPGKVYAEGYKKLYYEFLGMDNFQNEQDNNLLVTPVLDSAKVPITTKKYTKYIIIGSIILLAIVVALYDFLKAHPEGLLITTQSDDGNDGSRQESPDTSYKTD
jgi:transcriptional regulator with XRE-family HTH domain